MTSRKMLDAARGDDRHIDRLTVDPLVDQHGRTHQGGADQQQQAEGRELIGARALHRVGDAQHGRVQGGGPPQHGANHPAHIDDVAGLVAAGQRHDRVREVGSQEGDERADQQPQRHRLGTGLEHQPHQHAEQRDVEQRVGQRHRDLAEGLGCVGDDRRHHEDPAQHADAHRHDQGVEQAGPITPGDAALRQPQHGQRDHAHAHPGRRRPPRSGRARCHTPDPAAPRSSRRPSSVPGRLPAPATAEGLGADAGGSRRRAHRQHAGGLVDEVLRVLRQQEVAQATSAPTISVVRAPWSRARQRRIGAVTCVASPTLDLPRAKAPA